MIRSKKRALTMIIVFGLFSGVVAAKTKLHDPKVTLKKEFWGKLYANGGTTFFCKDEFSKKSVLVTESYIYSSLWIRDYLDCGTPRQCRKNSGDYRQITSDLHNIYPVRTRFELERRAAKFEELDEAVEKEECGIRRVFGVIEPADEVKGDLARAILYMHVTYDLPVYGDLTELKRWHRADLPSADEIKRNLEIREIQGNENFLITNPDSVNEIN